MEREKNTDKSFQAEIKRPAIAAFLSGLRSAEAPKNRQELLGLAREMSAGSAASRMLHASNKARREQVMREIARGSGNDALLRSELAALDKRIQRFNLGLRFLSEMGRHSVDAIMTR